MRPTPNARDHYRKFEPVQMRWADTDIYGHMNNAVHYTLFDTAVQRFLTENRLLDLGQSDTVFLVVDSGCGYFDEITFGDDLVVGLKVAKLGKSSITYDIGLFRNANQNAAAQGHFTHVNVTRAEKRPIAFTQEARATFSQLM